MKKVTIILCFLLLSTKEIFSFDFARYQLVALEDIDGWIHNYMAVNPPGGIGLFADSISLKINVNEFPRQITADTTRRAIQLYFEILNMTRYEGDDYFIILYGHYTTYEYNSITYMFLFQNQLVEHYISELNVNDEVTLYLLFGLFNETTKTAYIFVNEFQRE
ncbi:MAG: hypothetical protein FWH12_09695 [Treponema sp.]|nr:hypothetical protein [Treponema sp.]